MITDERRVLTEWGGNRVKRGAGDFTDVEEGETLECISGFVTCSSYIGRNWK